MNAVDQSTITNGSITSWTWYINNNYYSQEQNPTITPYLEGILPVTLIVESNTYCRDTVSKNILVHRKPIVSFNAQPIYGAVPLTVDFENLSELGNSYWSFGDGFNSLLTNPTHIYQDTGLFQTYLVLTNLYGCKDSVEKSIMVVPNIVDLAVQQVSFTESNSLINITAKIANLGTIPIMNPMLTFYTNEQQRITEVVNTTLFSSDILNYTFHGKISTQYANPSYICVEGNLSQPLIETTLLNNVSCCVTQNQDSFLNLYPNPAEENLNVLFQLTEDQEIRVQLVNSIGKEIIDQTVQATNGFNQITIDVSGFSQGVYMIVIHAKNTTFVKMFMKA
jgi:PKD repeat protein